MESAHPSDDEVAEGEAKRGIARGAGGGSDGGGGRPRVLPAPITEAIMPVRTRLQESGAEVAVYYSQIEGQVTKIVGGFIRPQPPPPPQCFPAYALLGVSNPFIPRRTYGLETFATFGLTLFLRLALHPSPPVPIPVLTPFCL